MKYGIYLSSYGPYGDPALLRDLAVEAEQHGWDGFFLWDIVAAYDEPPVVDPWVVLGAVAQATSTIAIGPMVVPLPRRGPVQVALEARTLQSLSGGRLILGVGAGAGSDYSRFGDAARGLERAQKLDEGVLLLRTLLAGGRVQHHGAHYTVDDVEFAPADVPIWTSGFWPRTGPVRGAAGADGCFPQTPGTDEEFPLPAPDEIVAFRDAYVAAGGSSSPDIAIWSPTPAGAPDARRAATYAAAGVTWWMQDGWKLSVDEVRHVIAAGPPRSER